LAVALGAATQAAIQSGATLGPVLVDVATHSLGIEAVGQDGRLKFCPIIHRNSPLPATYEEEFYTSHQEQEIAKIHAWQGESDSLLHNRSIGEFLLEGLNSSDKPDRRIRVRFDLSLDGTLSVSARHNSTGIQKSIQIQNATSRLESNERAAALERIDGLFGEPDYSDDYQGNGQTENRSENDTPPTAGSDPLKSLIQRAERACDHASAEDAEEIRRLVKAIDNASQKGDDELSSSLLAELDDLLFYVTDR
jgi:molecular chaperone DnaK